MKKTYEAPELELTSFQTETVMTGSNTGGGGGIVLPEDEW